jgi:ketosteroid isomerase-like protein
MRCMRITILSLIMFTIKMATAQDSAEAVMVKQADQQLNTHITNHSVEDAEKFYADDFILTTSTGKIKHKQDLLQEISLTTLKMEVNKTEDVEVHLVGTTAVLTGVLHQKGVYNDLVFDVWLRVTDTWVRTIDGWKLLAGHAGLFTKN